MSRRSPAGKNRVAAEQGWTFLAIDRTDAIYLLDINAYRRRRGTRMDATRKRVGVTFVIGVLAGVLALAVYALSIGGALTQSARVKVVDGVTTGVNASGTAIGFRELDGGSVAGYAMSGATWSTRGGSWHEALGDNTDGSCLKPLSSGQKLRLGIVNVPAGDAPGGSRVMWFQCLGQ